MIVSSKLAFVCILLSHLWSCLGQLVSTFAGQTNTGRTARGDGGQAVAAAVDRVRGIHQDSGGNYYFIEYNYIRKVAPDGIISTVIGGGGAANTGDGIVGTTVYIDYGVGITADTAGRFYYSQRSGLCVIRTFSTANNAVTTYAGQWGSCTSSADGISRLGAFLYDPCGLFYYTATNKLYIAEVGTHKIRVIDIASNILSTIAGTGTTGISGDNGDASSSALASPHNVWVNSNGEVLIADTLSCRIRIVHLNGKIGTVAGTSSCGTVSTSVSTGVSALATNMFQPVGLCGDSAGNVYFHEQVEFNFLRVAPSGIMTRVAGNLGANKRGSGIAATSVTIGYADSCIVDLAGNLVFGDIFNPIVWKVTGPTSVNPVIYSFVGLMPGVSVPATSAVLGDVYGLWGNTQGEVFVSDYDNHRVLKVSAAGILTVYAGTGMAGDLGTGLAATSSALNNPWALAGDDQGVLFIADYRNNYIRRVTAGGILQTIAGNGLNCTSSYNYAGSSTLGALCRPKGLALYQNNNLLYMSDEQFVIRRIDLTANTIYTFAGLGFFGMADGGIPSSAVFSKINSLWFNGINLYASDPSNYRIRLINTATNIVSTFAGNGGQGFCSSCAATTNSMYAPTAVCGDSTGVKMATAPFRLLKVDFSSGLYVTQVGNAVETQDGEGIARTIAKMGLGGACFVDGNGAMYYSESFSDGSSRVRVLKSASPTSQPSSQPSRQPLSRPSGQPTRQPSMQPSLQPLGRPTGQPSSQPSQQPSQQPAARPSTQPSRQPTSRPSVQPSSRPTMRPSVQPTLQPSSQPVLHPTGQPSRQPSAQPSNQPNRQPSSRPSGQPSNRPTRQPSSQPSVQPTGRPSRQPSTQPSAQPSIQPSSRPSRQPSSHPSSQPSVSPSMQPSTQPSGQPSNMPSMQPSGNPSGQPSTAPSAQPSGQPTMQPTGSPSCQPSARPSTQPSGQPSGNPSAYPSMQPSGHPSLQPFSQPSAQPSVRPSGQPSVRPTSQPSDVPSCQPSATPSTQPSLSPTGVPSRQPSRQPSAAPTGQPSSRPSSRPTVQPSEQPSTVPSAQPSGGPSAVPSGQPSTQPSVRPTNQPSGMPSGQPSGSPSSQPTMVPSSQPSKQPSGRPSVQPSKQPTAMPSRQPSALPTGQPSHSPSGQPSSLPSAQPSMQPSSHPSGQPSALPSGQPSGQPSSAPSVQPSSQPSASPSCQPSVSPTRQPSVQPSRLPTVQPSSRPSTQPSSVPTRQPSRRPSAQPTAVPSAQPSRQPSRVPSVQPSARPSGQPSSRPSSHPSAQPSNQPTARPSAQPSGQPTKAPSWQPTSKPSKQPNSRPSTQPSSRPSRQPSSMPSGQPSTVPSSQPSAQPMLCPTSQPSLQPTSRPSSYLAVILITSASFSSDGLQVLVQLNLDTNMAGLSNFIFPCNRLLVFLSADSYRCSWASASQLIVLDTVKPTLTLGSGMALAAGSGLTIKCTSICRPSVLSTTSATVSVSFAVKPFMQAFTSATISSCSAWMLDFTAVQGNAGRDWKNATFHVTSMKLGSDASAVEEEMSRQFLQAPVINIPADLLVMGEQYQVTAIICNFLGSCTSRTMLTDIVSSTSVLTVRVVGIVSNARKLHANEDLSLTADASITQCDSNIQTSLSYSWRVRELSNATWLSWQSQSKATNKFFRFAGQGLLPNKQYVVQVIVTERLSRLTASSNITLSVLPSELIASLMPSVPQQLALGSGLKLDASSSNDPDGMAALLFSWSCSSWFASNPDQLLPCRLTVVRNSSAPSVVQVLASNSTSLGAMNKVTVVVSAGQRRATASVDIQVISATAPMITILTDATAWKYANIDESLSISSAIQTSTTCLATWRIQDLTLNTSAVLGPSASLPQLVGANQLNTISLFVAAHTLSGGAAYTFTLSCNSSSLALTVMTNSPPQGGQLSASPSVGFALNSTFQLHTFLWADADLPMSYAFSFLANGLGMSIRGRSELQATSALLPAGNAVTVMVEAFDVFNAKSPAVNDSVQVKPLPASVMSTYITTLLSASVSAVNVNQLQNVISVASSMLNVANCSLASNCTGLHRGECLDQDHTCGACLEGYSSGDEGNSMCLLTSAVLSYAPSTAGCERCAAWQVCNHTQARCQDKDKICSSSCAAHGRCLLISSNTGQEVQACSIMSAACEAICECDAGYHGADCSQTTVIWSTELNTRAALLSGLTVVMGNSDVEQASTISAATSLRAVASDSQVITGNVTNSIASVAATLIDQAVSLSMASKDISALLISLDAAMLSAAENVSSLVSVLQDFVSLTRSDARAVEYLQSTFRMSAVKLDNALGKNMSIALPMTAAESISQLLSFEQQPVVTIVATNASLDVAVLLLKQRLWTNASMRSDIVSVTGKGMGFVDVLLPISASRQDDEGGGNRSYTITCLAGEVRSRNATCPGSGRVFVRYCNGTAGNFVGPCPALVPTCSSLDLLAQLPTDSNACKTINSTAFTMTCRCNTSTNTGARRRLSADDAVVEAAVTLGLIMEYAGSDLSATFHASPALFTDPHALQKVYVVVALFGLLWSGALLAMVCFKWSDTRLTSKLARKRHAALRGIHPLAEEKIGSEEARKKLVEYISSIFPFVFESQSVLMGLKHELFRHHAYVSFLCQSSHNRTPVISVIKMLTMQSFMLFLLALLYDLNYPDDDGSCATHTTEMTCLERKYILERSRSYCDWQDSCHFAEPNYSFTSAMYFAMLISIVTCATVDPLGVVMGVLAAPTSSPVTVHGVSPAPAPVAAAAAQPGVLGRASSSSKLTSLRILPDAAVTAHAEASQYSQEIHEQADPLIERREAQRVVIRQQLSRRLSALLGLHTAASSEHPLMPATTKTFAALQHDLLLQRSVLSDEQRQSFDEIWALDPVSGQFLEYRQRRVRWQIRNKPTLFVENVVKQELRTVTALSQEISHHLAGSPDVNKGFEILELFLRDLLGRDTPAARIFACKAELDFERVTRASWLTKWTAGAFIFALNAFFVYYTLSKGYTKGLAWQKDYIKAWGVQLLLDVLLFETLECIWLHVAVPYLVSGEVQRAYEILQQTIAHLHDSAFYDNTAICLNAAEYLFVSHRIAADYPHLVESTIVRAYSSHLPGQLGRVWQAAVQQQKAQITRSTWAARLAQLSKYFLMSLLVQIAAYAPLHVQRTFMRVLEPMLLSGLTLAFFYLLHNPLLIVAFGVFVLLLLVLLLWDYYRVKKGITAAIAAARQHDQSLQQIAAWDPLDATMQSTMTAIGAQLQAAMDEDEDDEQLHRPTRAKAQKTRKVKRVQPAAQPAVPASAVSKTNKNVRSPCPVSKAAPATRKPAPAKRPVSSTSTGSKRSSAGKSRSSEHSSCSEDYDSEQSIPSGLLTPPAGNKATRRGSSSEDDSDDLSSSFDSSSDDSFDR